MRLGDRLDTVSPHREQGESCSSLATRISFFLDLTGLRLAQSGQKQMTQDKAREFFSAYYEGTLDRSLRQAFEHRLNSDPVLQGDYAAFVETMAELEMLPHEEIEIPMYLNDRISSRLEGERSKQRNRVPIWSVWLRGLSFAGLATAAIAGAFLSINHGGKFSKADIVASGTSDRISFATRGSQTMMDYRPGSEQTVVVSSGINGKEIKRFVADATSPSQPFDNPQQGTALFQIQVLGQSGSTLLAVPGKLALSGMSGDGSLGDYAVALADRYRTPIVVRVSNPNDHVAWKFDGTDVRQAAGVTLKDTPYMVDTRETGILNITDR